MTALKDTFWVTLHFRSDWHIGSGQGRAGAVDAEVRRDADGLPFVPAKTLIGLWRDACEGIAHTLDADDPGAAQTWTSWVTWLFGSQPAQREDVTAKGFKPPTPAALRLTPARMPADLRTAVRGRPALQQAAVVLRPGVAIDPDTGTARNQMLRLEERAICGSTLVATASLGEGASDGSEIPASAELLLRAGARLIEAVGGKRHRGAGRVEVHLHAAQPPEPRSWALPAREQPCDQRLNDLLARTSLLDSPGRPPVGGLVPARPPATAAPTGWTTWRLTMVVETPVVNAERVRGNVIETRDTISGTALLGSILRHVTSPAGTAPLGIGDIRVGDAVPALPDGTPAYVTPRTWSRGDKGKSLKVTNASAGGVAESRSRSMSGRIASVGDREWQPVEVDRTISTHAIIDDQAQRATTESGGVFVYVGIAPETVLASDIVLPQDSELTLTPDQQLRFGRSRKDDFGIVRVIRAEPLHPDERDKSDPTSTSGLGGQSVNIWCISDVLLRNERLAFDPSAEQLASVVGKTLGRKAAVVAEKTTLHLTRRDGFAVAWGRPRSSHIAIAAGSVITVDFDPALAPEQLSLLADLEQLGIGERTAEGYGRVKFNPTELLEATPRVRLAPARPSPDHDQPDSRDPWPEAEPHPIELAAWRRAIGRAAAEHCANVLPEITRAKASEMKAQLGSLRSLLPKLTTPQGREQAQHWLRQTKSINARRALWGDATLDTLAKLIDQPDSTPDPLWKLLALSGDQPDLTLGPGRADPIRGKLRSDAAIILLTETLRYLTHTKQDT